MKKRYKIPLGFLAVVAVGVGIGAAVLSHSAPCPEPPALADDVETMQAITGRCYGSADVLALERVAKPVPAADEILVRIENAAVNPLDYHYMRGSPYVMRLSSGIGSPGDPRVGVDFAGVVEAVGASVTKFAPGDAVFGGRNGAFAEYVAVRETGAVAKKPDNVSFAEAAAVGIAGATALQALRDKGGLRSGEHVLVNGASGGVGTFAVQIAKAMGATVSGVCSTRNVGMVRSIGADRVFDYTRESYLDADERFDLIVDMVGNYSPSANHKMLGEGGRMVIVGGPKGNWLAPFRRPLQAMWLGNFVDNEIVTLFATLDSASLEAIAALMATGEVKPVIDRHYPLAEVPDAIRYSETRRARGKIIVDVP